MLKAYENNVHLLFLPPHTSYVLQPLDLSVFGPLKQYYRSRIQETLQAGFHEDSIASKRTFLDAYHWARTRAFSGLNIKAGWKVTGLWPVNVNKPLNSRQLLSNSNPTQLTKLPPRTPKAQSFHKPILELNDGMATVWSTPRKSKELRDQGKQFLEAVRPSPRERM